MAEREELLEMCNYLMEQYYSESGNYKVASALKELLIREDHPPNTDGNAPKRSWPKRHEL